MTRAQSRITKSVLPMMIATVILNVSLSAQAFSILSGDSATVQQSLQEAARWSSTSGLDDGIQVGIQTGFAANLGATGGEVALLNQAVMDAFEAWETDDLLFDITLDAAGVVESSTAGFEIDLFAVPGSHSVFGGAPFFGVTPVNSVFEANRPLTNGQSFAGNVITGADIYINVDNVVGLSAALGFNQAQQLASLQRLLMHEIGHAIGLGHSNANNPFGTTNNYDTDTDAFNSMNFDPSDPYGNLLVSANTDDTSIMSNRPCGEPSNFVGCSALFFTTLQNDDRGGRDALYPAAVPEPSTGLLLAGGLIALSSSRYRKR